MDVKHIEIETIQHTEISEDEKYGEQNNSVKFSSQLAIADNVPVNIRNKPDLLELEDCGSNKLQKKSFSNEDGRLVEEKPLMEKFRTERKLKKEHKGISSVAGIIDFSLFRNPIFILFSVSNFCTSLGFNVPFVYIVSLAQMKGISEREGSYLLSIIGISNTSGRLVLGYFFDQKFVNRQMVYSICLIIGGLSTALSTLCSGLFEFALYAAIFGFTVGAYAGLTSVIVVDLLGLDKLSSVFGLLLLFQGIANLLGPPITGWLFDSTQSFMPGFVVAGAVISGSGILLFALPLIQAYILRKDCNSNNV